MPSLCPIYNSIPHAMIQPSSSRSSLSHRSCKLMPKSVTASSPNSGSGSSGGGSGGAGSSPSNLVRFLQLLGVLLIATTFYFWRQPANTNPEAFSLPPASLPVKRSNILGKAEVLWKHRLTRGPESFAFEPEPYGKYVYTGTLDGKILRMNAKNPKGSIPQYIISTGNPELALPLPCGTPDTMPICGRPLGLEFDSNGDLYIADAYKGLMKLDFNKRSLETLTNQVNGVRLAFTNSLAIAEDVDEDGNVVSRKIYFTDSSRHQLHNLAAEMFEAGPYGRVLEYDTATRTTRVVATGLHFANGLVITPDQRWVIVSELTRARLTKVGIAPDNYGVLQPFSTNLPILPDNVTWGPIDEETGEATELWVAGTVPRYPGHFSLFDFLASYPKLRKVLAKIINTTILGYFTPKYGGVLRIDAATGEVLELLEDTTGRVKYLAEAKYHNGYMYLGSYRGEVRQVSRIPWDPKTRSTPLLDASSTTKSSGTRQEL